MTTTNRIIDEIDALVDAQLQQEASGYDWNINQDRCPHCHREWHGMAITEDIEQMREAFAYGYRVDDDLDSYRADQDDSEILCPGSMFVGPRAPQPHEQPWCPHGCPKPWHQEATDICPGSMHHGPRRATAREERFANLGNIRITMTVNESGWDTERLKRLLWAPNQMLPPWTELFADNGGNPWSLDAVPAFRTTDAVRRRRRPNRGHSIDRIELDNTPRADGRPHPPRPATTPPMWAQVPNRSRRQR